MGELIKILGFAGSLRKESYNRSVLRAAVKLGPHVNWWPVLGRQGMAGRVLETNRHGLNWAGKAERLSFDVPTLPLFIHERLSTKAIIETLAGHKTDKQEDMFALFGDPQHSITDQVLKAYEYQDDWTNRMVLGDSLVVMNSLLHYEGLGGQVQMIYMDPRR